MIHSILHFTAHVIAEVGFFGAIIFAADVIVYNVERDLPRIKQVLIRG